jgi:hypothetical protein
MPKVRKPKKGKKYLILSVVMALILAFTGLASAEMVICDPQSDLNSGQFCKDGYSGSAGWINALHFEGATSDAYETHLYVVDPTSDNVIRFKDESGDVMVSTDSFSISGASDGQILVFNATDGWAPDSHTLTGEVTGTMANTGAVATTLVNNTVDSANVVNGTIAEIDTTFASYLINIPSGSATTTETLSVGNDLANITGIFAVANVASGIVLNTTSIAAGVLTVTLDANCDASASTDCVWRMGIWE